MAAGADHVLTSIDGALESWAGAMRWSPEPDRTVPPDDLPVRAGASRCLVADTCVMDSACPHTVTCAAERAG